MKKTVKKKLNVGEICPAHHSRWCCGRMKELSLARVSVIDEAIDWRIKCGVDSKFGPTAQLQARLRLGDAVDRLLKLEKANDLMRRTARDE